MNSPLLSPRDTVDGPDEWFERSLIMKKWRELRTAIELHKWIESERAGYDIGWDRAYFDYMRKNRKNK